MTTTTNLIESGYLDWPGAQQLIRFERTTIVHGKRRSTTTYAITNLPREQANAKKLLALLRGRWAIENRCFHVLDTTFKEDHNRTRTGHAAQALSNLRHFTIAFARRLGQSITCTITEHALNPTRLFTRLGIMKN